jgi:hypothetical protein
MRRFLIAVILAVSAVVVTAASVGADTICHCS